MTWNVGGLSPPKVAGVLKAVAHSTGTDLNEMYNLCIVFLQEITVGEDEIQHREEDGWHIISGKTAGEWRGRGIAYRQNMGVHSATKVRKGCLSTTLSTQDGKLKVGLASIHVPHHATIAETEVLLADIDLGTTKLVLGMDANETFDQSARGETARTGRGECLLQWLANLGVDYLAARGMQGAGRGRVVPARDIAASDHEPVVAQIPWRGMKSQARETFGPRKLKQADKVEEALRSTPAGDLERAIAEKAEEITVPGRACIHFRESQDLKHKRRRAMDMPPGQDRRHAWKQIAKQRKKEHRQWQEEMCCEAAKGNWLAAKSLQHQPQAKKWEHGLLDDPNWRDKLQAHFEGIFCKGDQARVDREIEEIRGRLARKCKETRWVAFRKEELIAASAAWCKGKSTGPDGISHEALLSMMSSPQWEAAIIWSLNDYLYKAYVPPNTGEGATILLPKVPLPLAWGETRPITLSSSMLKWLSQLLLQRVGDGLDTDIPYQWARKGRQATELLFLIRRIVQMTKDWGLEMWIAKIDVKKAFDSVWQESLARLVERRVENQCNQPWEARAWLALLQARELHVHTDGGKHTIKQTNGVRQGSPDSPKLFSALVGEALNEAFEQAADDEQPEECQPIPHPGASFMDDTYLWAQSPDQLQRYLRATEETLKKDGLEINTKTVILCSKPTDKKFHIGGGDIQAKGPEAYMRVLGAPVGFEIGPAALAAEMANRARRAFYSRRKILVAKGPVKVKLQLHNSYVRGAALWGCQAWPAHRTVLMACNSTQLHQVRLMLNIHRAPGEAWVEEQQVIARSKNTAPPERNPKMEHSRSPAYLGNDRPSLQRRRSGRRHPRMEGVGMVEKPTKAQRRRQTCRALQPPDGHRKSGGKHCRHELESSG